MFITVKVPINLDFLSIVSVSDEIQIVFIISIIFITSIMVILHNLLFWKNVKKNYLFYSLNLVFVSHTLLKTFAIFFNFLFGYIFI